MDKTYSSMEYELRRNKGSDRGNFFCELFTKKYPDKKIVIELLKTAPLFESSSSGGLLCFTTPQLP